ncbi:hypothetical protein [Sorangium sp. So ce145]|uniref:hypothetical protein n=1 Tax=Sorangium sp. So ce145 TaxID=3133285 RepID=UPI003F61EBAF
MAWRTAPAGSRASEGGVLGGPECQATVIVADQAALLMIAAIRGDSVKFTGEPTLAMKSFNNDGNFDKPRFTIAVVPRSWYA